MIPAAITAERQKPMLVAMRLLLVCRSCYATGLSYLRAVWTRVIDYKRLSATTAEVNVTYTASVAAVANTTPAAINGSMVNHIVCRPIFSYAAVFCNPAPTRETKWPLNFVTPSTLRQRLRGVGG